uniref:prostaglandin reductase 1-like isoform X1 n=1 Tax=Styela clava TaxID=7725 RepID=UPI0019395F88|nr:prostaglandin reductase 1-like isoform X1 [Styela clava]
MKISKIILRKQFDGFPKESDFELVEEDLGDDLKDDEFFFEALYISCDPYIRILAPSYKEGETVIPGYQLSRVTKSNNSKYPVGSILVTGAGWRTGGKSSGVGPEGVWYERNDLPKNVPQSAGVGIFAMTGLTACYGVEYVLKPKKGETLFVSASAGAVGNIAGQIGKILGCRVVGSCGSDEKIKYVKSIGFDDAFNYKTESVEEGLKRVAPEGVDLYFDNVGGDFASAVLKQMNRKGRIAVCGMLSSYNEKEPRAHVIQQTMFMKSLLMQGFNIFADIPPYNEEIYKKLKKWAEEGKLKQYESISEGFKNLPSTFIGMLCGKNLGKTIVKL